MKKLVLASSSLQRQLLLKRLQLPYTTIDPNVDETPLAGESPEELVQRLALAKAQVSANLYDDALIIGGDQVAVVEKKIIGKPLSIENAKHQLRMISGKRIRFFIGLCLYQTKSNTYQLALETYDVIFRNLSDAMIEYYLLHEQPLECAGSCKADGLGITLVEVFEGKDFTALIGLPLIRLTQMLKDIGYYPS